MYMWDEINYGWGQTQPSTLFRIQAIKTIVLGDISKLEVSKDMDKEVVDYEIHKIKEFALKIKNRLVDFRHNQIVEVITQTDKVYEGVSHYMTKLQHYYDMELLDFTKVMLLPISIRYACNLCWVFIIHIYVFPMNMLLSVHL